jgi:hypothetical protein
MQVKTQPSWGWCSSNHAARNLRKHLFHLATSPPVIRYGFLSPLPPWYLPFDLGVDMGGSGSQRGAMLCIASFVQARCPCSA